MTFSDFFKKFNEENNSKNWWYFDYKHINEWLSEKAEKMDINWKDFGHPEITAKGSTLWIGTKGAHTPCHVDTYGCNLVAQLYGKISFSERDGFYSLHQKPTTLNLQGYLTKNLAFIARSIFLVVVVIFQILKIFT